MKMYKSKRQKNKSFDWYGLSQRFSIRKYHFGAASVLLGTALILGAAQTTVKAEEAAAENKTEAVTSTSKDDERAVAPANVTLPATEARTGTPVLDKKELSEEDIAKLVAEASKKDEKATETATTDKSEDADKEKASLTAASTEDKSKKAVDDKTDKKDEKKAENPISATKTILEQLTSEAEVLNTTAANYAEKKVEDKSSKEAIVAAVAAAKVEITASKKVLIDKDVTVEQLNLQLQRISSAIEAVYTEMKRAGHIGKVEAVLAGETSTVVNVVAPLTKTAVKNLTTLTEEEIRAIEKEVRSSNLGLTDEDTVTVSKEGIGGTAGAVTVTLAAGRLTQNGTNTITFGSTDVVVGTAGTKNVEQLKNAINWFDFANASITYPDGTKVSAVKYLNAPESRTVQSPNRGNITGNFTMYREVLDSPDKTLIGKRTIDQEVIDKGFAKYAFNRTYNKVNRENNALYEVLQEGMKFNVKTKVEGYELTATVAKLAPKQVKNSVIPQDKNYSRNLNEDGSYDPAYVILKPQDENYSTLGKSGIQTTYRDESGVERKMLTAFASADDGGNVGVTFDLAATFNGRPVAVNAIAADSEDLNGHEFTQFETNGTPWKEFMTVQPKNAKGGIVLNTNPLGYNVGKNDPTGSFGLGIKRANNEKFLLGYNNDEWKNNTANNEEPGFGSTLFGPFISPQDGGTLPIGITQNVSRLSVYVNAAGNQTATIGFVVYDGGDAPESYGSAQHIIGIFNKEKDGKQVTATQPYLGDQPADPDFRNTTTEPSGAWVLDDLVHTEKYEEIPLKHGDKISNALGETGTYDIVDGVSVIRVSSTKTIAIKQGEIVSINRPKKAENSTELVEVPVRGVFNNASQSVGIGALPDEGEKQLIDPSTGIKEYTLRQATDNEYVLEGIRVNRGVNNDDAYVRAWVDFNNNGKFDQFEASDVAHITQDGTINLSFKNTPQLLDTSVDSIGVRIRIALKEKEILVPTGIASSGEVEDFLTHVVHFPRGTRHRSEGYQGQKQEVNVPTTAMFRANGKSKDSDYKKWAEMEQTIAPKFVLTESTVASAEETGNEVNITLKGTTVYGGKEVVLKNAKGQTLATAIKVTNPNNGKVEYLTSEYTEYDTKGNKVGVYTLNPEGENGKNTDGPGNLKYTKVTFKPELGYVGTANGVAIRAWDENRNSTGWEATATTIKQATEDNTLADKDKISENVNKKTNGRLSMDTVYIPKVIDIKPVGKDETTIDEQGKQQSATPKIPDHGTVESINNEHIDEAKVDKSHVLINRYEPVKFSLVKDIPGKTYTEDTKVTEKTVITYEDGGTEEFKPVDKIPGTTNIAETQDLTVTGTGNVTVSNVRIAKGTLSTNAVPAGAILEGARPKAAAPVTVLRNGVEVIVNTGEYIEKGDQLVTPLQVLGGDQTTTWKITFQKGDVIPKASANITPRLASETSVDQLINTKGESLILGGKEYVNNNDVIPKGTKTAGTTVDLTTVTLPKATHVNPKTGEVTTVERRYTKVTENEIEIENEGTYTLVPRTSTDAQGKTVYEDAEIIFKPHPSFVGVGTGVTIKQPDTDYDGPVETDKVTKRYGVDYGSAKYTPTVTPNLTATITRKIHYVYEGDAATAPKDKTPILSIDNKPVVNEQTLTYDRDYIIMENDGETKKDIKVSTVTTLGKPITIKRLVKENNQTVEKEITTNVLQPGDEVKAGTRLSAGTVIIGAWKPVNDENAKFSSIISPVLKGYTAEVQLPASEYTKKDENGVQTHVRSANNTPAGIYTPLAQGGTVDTVNVGTYEPLVSVVRADDQDDFDVYVYYKADKQKANVVYIDLDEKGDKRVLETQSGTKVTELPTGATQDPKTTYGVEKLSGNSDSTIPYATAETIKKYVDKGYELASDDYTNDENGRALADGRKFDEDSSVDQTFYVYLRHKKEQLSKNDVRTVTRHIEYKYADTTDVPADKRNQPVETTLAKKVTEVLTFERTRSIDMAATAKLYETQYNAYKAVVANNAVGSDAEVEARATLFKYVEDKAKEAGATDEAKAVISYGEWQAKPGQATNLTLSAAEENIKDSKFNDVVSPTVPGYLPDNAKVEATADVNPESDPKEYTVTVTYTPVEQKAIVNFVEVDATNTDQVITPGLADPVTFTGKSGTAFPATASASVQAKIDELVKKGYELVANGNGFVATDSFDTDVAVDQTYTVKLRVKPITVTPNDPTPTPNTPIDPNNPTGPKWTPELIKELEDGRKEEVKRTINYVYADGTKAKDSVEETKEFKRSATINPVTGKITFGEWSAAQRFEEKQSPAIDNYTPDKASVEAKEVTATADDITETVIYSTSKITVDPNPVDPNGNVNPNAPVPGDPLNRTYKDLGLVEEVKHTIHYVYEDGTKADEDVVQTLTYTRTAKIDPVTGAISDYSGWTAKKGDDFTAVDSPAKDGYIVSKAASTAINDVPATADDTEETIIYRKLGSYIPVVPEGVTVPPGTDTTAKVYPKNPNDPTKPGTPTTTIPEIPGTTPVGPDGTPLTKNPNGGYDLPPVPTDPTQNTTITYVKDGSQVAVTHFIEVNSATDKTEKGAVAQSVVDTGDTGKAFTKGQSVTDTINALKAKGYTVVENGYPENGTFDADATTNQEYKVLVTVKPVTITPNTDVPNPEDPNTPVDPNNPIQPGKPIDPTNPEGPKWTKDLIDKLRDARKEEVTRTITYKYSDVTSELKAEDAAKAGQTAADTVTNTVTFKRSVTIDPVTKEFTYGDWEATNGTTLAGKAALPVVPGYVATGDVDSSKKDVENVTATDKDITENVVYKTVGKYVPVIPEGITPPANTNVDPKPYTNDPQDGSKVKDPDPTNPVVPGTTTPIVPQIPGTTPVGPDGKPLKPVDPADPSKGYVPPTPADPTKDTSIIYVKDGSQVAVVHFVDEKGNSVNESVVETGDTGATISKSNVDKVKAALEAKGYTVVAPTDALYTTDKEGFYKEENRTFDAVSDKATGKAGEKVPSQQYYVIVKAKEIPADPTKPGTNPGTDTPANPTDPTNPTTPAKPGDKIPGDPLNRTYGDLGLVEEVTRTINYVKNDGTKAADPVKETLTFTRKAKINAVTGEVTYLAADGVTPVASKEDAPWTATNNDTTFDKVTSPSVENYTPTKAEVPAKDNVKATDEDIVETVVYNPTKQTIDPNKPVDPNSNVTPKPTDPVPNDPKGRTYEQLGLIETVTRTVHYVYEDGTKAAEDKVQTITFTRTADIDIVTGAISNFGEWKVKDENTTFESETTEPKAGYIASAAKSTEVTGVKATDKDTEETIIYRKLGSFVPSVPEGYEKPQIPTPQYPNEHVDPNDPTSPLDPTKPGTPTTTIPHVPGLTPLDPSTGKPLEPKDPNDVTKGYNPPVPQDPTKDTTVVYAKDGSQVTVVHFVDEDGNAVHTSLVEAGSAGAKFTKADEVAKIVADLEKAGYSVVPNKEGQKEYPAEADRVFDNEDDKGDKGVSQVYYVTVGAKNIPVTPTNPQNPNEDPKNPNPGDPIDPNNPTGPKWTKDALDKLNNIKSVTRTITYVKDGTDEEVSPTEAPKVTDKVSFTRTAIVNPKDGSVVGYDTNGDGKADVPATDTDNGWTAVNNDTTFDKVTSPVVKGYVLKDTAQKEVAETTGLTPKSDNENIKVVYVPVGTWTPKVPEGETPIDPIPYPNDPKDPGKVVDPNDPTNPNDPNKPSIPVIPHIPGTTPKDPNGNPLKPVDPTDPSKGYVPPTPKTPTENTEINYEKDTQKAVTKFVDTSGNPIPGVNNIDETGKSGEPLTKATEVTTEIAKLIAKGYDLVSNNYGKDNNGNFDKDKSVDQEYTVVLTPHVEPIKPFDPTNPNDPNKPEPGKPIDPNNPDGPKWTKELIDKLNTTKHVTRTITYVEDATDKEVADKATDKVTFTREAKINLVTGTIEYGKWTPVNNDTTFDKVTSPVVKGYVLKDASQKDVAATENLTENSKDENIKVVYVPVGRLVPKVPEGVIPPTPTPYDNVPGEPGKVVPPSPTKPTDPQDPNSPKVPVIPHIPGTTPQVPKDPTKPVDPNTNPLVPLKPIDPKDPSKGYEVPPVPTNPGTDTPIYYVNDKQKAITNFVDNNGKVVSDSVVDQGDSGSKFTKSGEVESKIKELVKKGYVVTSNDYPSVDKDRVFDKDKDKDQIFNVKVTPLIVPTDPNSPDKPMVPTDPTKPVGPNNPLRPVTPSTPEPGKPVFPEDPNSPVWPETVKDLVTESSATRTITYVDRNGKEVAATHTETIKFKRSAKVNLVTGEITYGDWTVVGDDTILDGNKLPKVDGYIARGGDIESSQKDIEAKPGVTITETVVYDKLGSWIPKLPEGQNQVPPTPYPNDPTDPTKPGTDKPKVPYVPGFIPVDPNGNPLKPVDPNDPTKGYEVPDVPADPTQDTPIKYIPVPTPNNGGGNNGGGGGNIPTPQPQPNPAPAPQPEPSPAPNPVPVTPETPEQPVAPVTPEQPAAPSTPQYMDGQRELPNTGTEDHASLAALGLLGALSGFGLIARKKREDEE